MRETVWKRTDLGFTAVVLDGVKIYCQLRESGEGARCSMCPRNDVRRYVLVRAGLQSPKHMKFCLDCAKAIGRAARLKKAYPDDG